MYSSSKNMQSRGQIDSQEWRKKASWMGRATEFDRLVDLHSDGFEDNRTAGEVEIDFI